MWIEGHEYCLWTISFLGMDGGMGSEQIYKPVTIVDCAQIYGCCNTF